MIKIAARALPVVLALVTGVVLAPQAAATTTPRSFADCMDIAVVDNGADPWIARDACNASELTTCFRTFRAVYGVQGWALEACNARTD